MPVLLSLNIAYLDDTIRTRPCIKCPRELPYGLYETAALRQNELLRLPVRSVPYARDNQLLSLALHLPHNRLHLCQGAVLIRLALHNQSRAPNGRQETLYVPVAESV